MYLGGQFKENTRGNFPIWKAVQLYLQDKNKIKLNGVIGRKRSGTIARLYSGKDEDLHCNPVAGLLKAVQRFDPSAASVLQPISSYIAGEIGMLRRKNL